MIDVPETRYARSGDVHIAYQVVGDGPIDAVVVPGWVSHVELTWEVPQFRRFMERIASFSRVMILDKRGTGASDRVVGVPTLEAALAEPNEVRVSSTVKDLVVGSGIGFADRGVHTLKGVPDEWRLYTVGA